MADERLTPAHAYCTYFDSGYLPRALALFDSLERNGDTAPIWVLALDDATADYLEGLARPGLHVIRADDLERTVPELAPLRSTRSRMEFYFTCTPLLLRHVMNALDQPGSVAIYLDADLFFFESPARVLEALGDGSVGIIEHRYPPALEKKLAKYGRFNVGWVGIRDDDNGRACVDWWSASCLEWCSDTPENGKYADQGYLDWFPERFDGVVSLQGSGLNLAPWNTARHRLTVEAAPGGRERVVIDDSDDLVFFHFHGVRRARGWFVTSQLIYRSPMRRVLREHVYAPYLAELVGFEIAVTGGTSPARAAKRGAGVRGLLFRLQRATIDRVSVATGNALRVKDLAPESD